VLKNDFILQLAKKIIPIEVKYRKDLGDSRVIVTPNNWIWPEEFAAIWTVYPYNGGTGEGVKEGNPPTFTQQWYIETLTNPTTFKWDPNCP